MADRPGSVDPTRAFYDRISHLYDAIADAAEHTARERGQDVLDVGADERVLEIGFGPGRALIAFARIVGPVGAVVGLDLSPGMTAEAGRRIDAAGLSDTIDLVVGDARSLPFDAHSFDAAFLSFTLELFSDADIPTVLHELRRVLRPGGRLAIVHMASTVRHGRMERVYEWVHRHFPHFVDCRPIVAAEALREAGFRVVSVEEARVCGLPVGIALAAAPKDARKSSPSRAG